MVEIDQTASNLLEKIATILEKPYNAIGLGSGLAVAVIILYHLGYMESGFFGAFFTVLHVISGITWIGLLYYFNLVQIPIAPTLPAELKPAIGKYIAPEALWWFRHSALATVVTGLIVFMTSTAVHNFTIITGALIGLLMAFNVWFIIWPNQQKVLGLVPADDETKANSARLAMLTSRANLVLSIPMIYCMVSARLLVG